MTLPEPRPVPHRIEPFWDAQLAIATVLVLYALLPDPLTLGPRWAVPTLCGVLLAALAYATPWGSDTPPARTATRRRLAILVIALVAVANLGALLQLVIDLISANGLSGRTLLRAAGTVWLATTLVFAVLFWELDRGGPAVRSDQEAVRDHYPDFMFPQMDSGAPAPIGWMPGFVDYLYLSFTNASAFSPTDTMPFTHTAKLLMLSQSVASFVLVVLVTARAVNILQ
ncbi:MAG: hypothetical protein JWO02_4710 [Solirubrobacterales bacterium]|nr:hypothetical protein [Solirubrobacterales bacterium]